jgi:hypothetical protein
MQREQCASQIGWQLQLQWQGQWQPQDTSQVIGVAM